MREIDDTHVGDVTVARFEAFYGEFRDSLYRALALSIGDVDLAMEAVDEAMTRALERWGQVSGYDKPEAWVYRVGLNWARSVFRRRRREDRWAPLDAEPSTTDPVPEPEVVEAVRKLPLRYRTVVVCRYYLDWSTDQTAEALGVPSGTVKSRLARALRRLGRELGGVA